LDTGAALVAEHYPGASIGRWAFSQRDRIQSGLSDHVFVVQIDGGSMHTVKFAGRDAKWGATYARRMLTFSGAASWESGDLIRLTNSKHTYDRQTQNGLAN